MIQLTKATFNGGGNARLQLWSRDAAALPVIFIAVDS